MIRILFFGIKRVLWIACVLFGVASLVFFLVHLLPGDASFLIVGSQASSESISQARKLEGLHLPLMAQYFNYWKSIFHFATHAIPTHQDCFSVGLFHVNLGHSLLTQKPVYESILNKLGASIVLAANAVWLQLVLGFFIGTISALTQNHWQDRSLRAITILLACIPSFVIGLTVQYWFAYRYPLFPIDGYGTTLRDQIHSFMLPSITLGLFGTALYGRLFREQIIEAMRAPYVHLAKAKGASTLRIVFYHVLPNAITPIATLALLDVGALIGGAVITETLFRWPGLGQLTFLALQHRDVPLITGISMFLSVTSITATTLVEILQSFTSK